MSAAAGRAVAHVRSLGVPGRVPPAPITVSFHPDRLLADGSSVAERLVAEGWYRSQFETGISNGGLMPFAGSDRDRWEQRMFGGAYPPGSRVGRPVYGGLNLAGFPDGASPRFGSCHLRLRPEVSARATFSLGDSVTEPSVVGTADAFGAVWAGLLASVASSGSAAGLAAGSPAEWVAALGARRTAAGRCLDGYVEAQIHGGVRLARDVEAVVVDPSFRGTRTVELLESVGPVEFSGGFVLPPSEFPDDLRGPAAARVARVVAARFGVGVVSAEVVGRAAVSVVRSPAEWSGFGSPAEVLQLLKYVWHILVLRGVPGAVSRGAGSG